jgi:hypothetical protein
MKSFNWSTIISSLILGAAIVVGCYGLQGGGDTKQPEVQTVVDKPLISIVEAADYLGLTEQQVKYIIASEKNALNGTGSFTGMMFPYITINKDIYISKAGLSAWLVQAFEQRKQY